MRPGFRDSATVRLTNILTVQKPGGRPRRYLRVKGQPLIPLPDLPRTDPAFVAAWAANRARFPRGVDVVLCAGDRIAALPRSVTIEEG